MPANLFDLLVRFAPDADSVIALYDLNGPDHGVSGFGRFRPEDPGERLRRDEEEALRHAEEAEKRARASADPAARKAADKADADFDAALEEYSKAAEELKKAKEIHKTAGNADSKKNLDDAQAREDAASRNAVNKNKARILARIRERNTEDPALRKDAERAWKAWNDASQAYIDWLKFIDDLIERLFPPGWWVKPKAQKIWPPDDFPPPDILHK